MFPQNSNCSFCTIIQTFPTGEVLILQQPHRVISIQAAATSGASDELSASLTQRSTLASWKHPTWSAGAHWQALDSEPAEGRLSGLCSVRPPDPQTLQQSGL